MMMMMMKEEEEEEEEKEEEDDEVRGGLQPYFCCRRVAHVKRKSDETARLSPSVAVATTVPRQPG